MATERGSFGPDSSNPRLRRAFAHTKIVEYKLGTASYEEAFSAAYKASQNRKGAGSNFGTALGGVVVDAYALRFDNDTVVVSGLSPRTQMEVETEKASGNAFGYALDAFMSRPNVNNVPKLGSVIKNPIKEGYSP